MPQDQLGDGETLALLRRVLLHKYRLGDGHGIDELNVRRHHCCDRTFYSMDYAFVDQRIAVDLLPTRVARTRGRSPSSSSSSSQQQQQQLLRATKRRVLQSAGWRYVLVPVECPRP